MLLCYRGFANPTRHKADRPMHRIVASITTLDQHLDAVVTNAEAYLRMPARTAAWAACGDMAAITARPIAAPAVSRAIRSQFCVSCAGNVCERVRGCRCASRPGAYHGTGGSLHVATYSAHVFCLTSRQCLPRLSKKLEQKPKRPPHRQRQQPA